MAFGMMADIRPGDFGDPETKLVAVGLASNSTDGDGIAGIAFHGLPVRR